MCTCCQENSLLFVFASFLQSFSEEPGPLLHSMPCGISLNGSLHQIACSQSQGNGKTEKGKDLLKITLRISRGKLEQEDGNFWSSDPTIQQRGRWTVAHLLQAGTASSSRDERGSRGAGAISHLRSLAGTLPLSSVLSPGVSVLASRLSFFLNGAHRGRNICHPEVGNSR